MQIRAASRNKCGGFTIQHFAQATKLSERTSRKHIAELLKLGYILKQKTNHYRIVRQKSLFNEANSDRYVSISNEQLFSYSYANLRHFRAFLVEIRIEQNRSTRKSLRHGITIVNTRGVKERIKNRSILQHDNFMASTYVSKMTGKHFSTILKYRSCQSVSKYSKRKVECVSDQYFKPTRNSSGYKKSNLDSLGKYFVLSDKLFFVPVSTRLSYGFKIKSS